MKKFIFLIILIIVIGVFTVLNLNRNDIESGIEFSLKVFETKTINDIEIKLRAVTEDSRCQRDTLCVWQGTLGVRLLIEENGSLSDISFKQTENPYKFGKYEIAIVGATPYPDGSGLFVIEKDYIVTFAVRLAPK